MSPDLHTPAATPMTCLCICVCMYMCVCVCPQVRDLHNPPKAVDEALREGDIRLFQVRYVCEPHTHTHTHARPHTQRSPLVPL